MVVVLRKLLAPKHAQREAPENRQYEAPKDRQYEVPEDAPYETSKDVYIAAKIWYFFLFFFSQLNNFNALLSNKK